MAFDVLIVDDSQPFLDAARDLLERQGLRIVGLASTSAEAMRRSAELHPDVVLIDITLASESPAAIRAGQQRGRADPHLDPRPGRLRRPHRRQPGRGVCAEVRAVGGCDPPDRVREWSGPGHALKGGGPLSSPAGAS
jgi:CheY-like chemotaxis protein